MRQFNPMNAVFAFCGSVLFAVLAFLLVTHGEPIVQRATVLGLFFGAVGQYLAQSDSYNVVVTAQVLSAIGIACAAAAVLLFL